MRRLQAVIVLLFVAGLPGCRVPGITERIARSLTASRQLSHQGLAAMERGQWDRAETLLSGAVRAYPSDPDARSNYAETLWHRGTPEAAVGQLSEAIRCNPENAAFHARLAEMQLELGKPDEAWASAQRAVELNPRLAMAWAVRARLQWRDGKMLDALADYHRAQHYAPSDRQYPMAIAELHLALEQPERALATLQGLIENYAPGEEPPAALAMQGRTYLALGRHEEAVESLAAACGDRADPELLVQLAEAQYAAGRVAEATATAHRVLEANPEHAAGRQLLSRLTVAGRTPDRVER